jgi:hypothetical protein
MRGGEGRAHLAREMCGQSVTNNSEMWVPLRPPVNAVCTLAATFPRTSQCARPRTSPRPQPAAMPLSLTLARPLVTSLAATGDVLVVPPHQASPPAESLLPPETLRTFVCHCEGEDDAVPGVGTGGDVLARRLVHENLATPRHTHLLFPPGGPPPPQQPPQQPPAQHAQALSAGKAAGEALHARLAALPPSSRALILGGPCHLAIPALRASLRRAGRTLRALWLGTPIVPPALVAHLKGEENGEGEGDSGDAEGGCRLQPAQLLYVCAAAPPPPLRGGASGTPAAAAAAAEAGEEAHDAAWLRRLGAVVVEVPSHTPFLMDAEEAMEAGEEAAMEAGGEAAAAGGEASTAAATAGAPSDRTPASPAATLLHERGAARLMTEGLGAVLQPLPGGGGGGAEEEEEMEEVAFHVVLDVDGLHPAEAPCQSAGRRAPAGPPHGLAMGHVTGALLRAAACGPLLAAHVLNFNPHAGGPEEVAASVASLMIFVRAIVRVAAEEEEEAAESAAEAAAAEAGSKGAGVGGVGVGSVGVTAGGGASGTTASTQSSRGSGQGSRARGGGGIPGPPGSAVTAGLGAAAAALVPSVPQAAITAIAVATHAKVTGAELALCTQAPCPRQG